MIFKASKKTPRMPEHEQWFLLIATLLLIFLIAMEFNREQHEVQNKRTSDSAIW